MFRTINWRLPVALLLAILALMLDCGGAVNALREVGGDETVGDNGWPDGALELANQRSRFRWSSGDFLDCEFLYRGDTDAFQKALVALATVRAPAREVVVHDGPYAHWVAKSEKDDGYIDWAFTVWTPSGWHELFNSPRSDYSRSHRTPVPPPRIDVYVGAPATPGGIDWTKVKMPDGITVKDERFSVRKEKPDGSIFHGVIYNMATGKTISGAGIEVQEFDKTAKEWKKVLAVSTDAAGAYRIEKLPLGNSCRIAAFAKGFASRVLGYTVTGAENDAETDGELSTEVKVMGTVTDEQDKPLRGVRVILDETVGIDGCKYQLPQAMKDLETTSDEAGRFSFSGAPTGYAVFHCYETGHQQLKRHTIHVLSSWSTYVNGDVKLTGTVPVDLRMAEPGTVHCKVASADDTPVNDSVNVSLMDAEGGFSLHANNIQHTAAIDRNGNVEFHDLAPGRYYVLVGYRIDNEPGTRIVTVNAGKTTEVALTTKMPKPRKAEEPVKAVPPPKVPDDGNF